MRILFLTLLILSATACAEDRDDCMDQLQSGRTLLKLTADSAKIAYWDRTYDYMDKAFFYLLKAQSACEGREEEYVLAKVLMDEYTYVSKQINCAFHTQQTHAHITQARKSETVSDATFHSGWAEYHVDEALTRCQYNPERIEVLTKVKGGLVAFNKKHEND